MSRSHFKARAIIQDKPRDSARALGTLTLVLLALLTTGLLDRLELYAASLGLVTSLLLYGAIRGQGGRFAAHLIAITLLGLWAGVSQRWWQAQTSHSWRVLLRMAHGLGWTLWLGSQLDWGSLRELLWRWRWAKRLVDDIDQAILYGSWTLKQWRRRQEIAQVRLGSEKLSGHVWATIIGQGALDGLEHIEQTQQTALLRAATQEADRGEDIVAQAIRVIVDERVVLDELTFQIEPSSWVALCGPSGAGKTTLLRTLAGLLPAERGELYRGGRRLSVMELEGRLSAEVALLSQNPSHHFMASIVRDDIAWGLIKRGHEPQRAHERVLKVASQLGIEDLLNRGCETLSFGEQRRVALAGLLVHEPKLLLLDEPTAGLDPVAAASLGRLIAQERRRRGFTCLWSSHDLNQLPQEIERVILLKEGGLVFDGPRAQALSPKWLTEAGLYVEPQARPS